MERMPFIENMDESVPGGTGCPMLKITKNGKYVTPNLDKVIVNVKGGESNTRVEGHTLIIE